MANLEINQEELKIVLRALDAFADAHVAKARTKHQTSIREDMFVAVRIPQEAQDARMLHAKLLALKE